MDDLVKDLFSGINVKVLQASIELSNRGKSAIPEMIRLLSTEADEKRQQLVAGVLSNIGEEVVPDVIDLMKQRDELKVICALILKDVGKNSVSHLLTGLLDSNPQIKAMIAEVLGEIKDSRALPHLKSLLEDDSEEVKIAAAEAIKEIEKPFASKVIDSIKYSVQIEKMLNNIEQ